MRSKKEPSQKEDRSQHPPSSDCFHGKRVPKDEEYEDDGTWIWVSMASECRMILAYAVGERNQTTAKVIVARKAKILATIPLFVTDGLKFYSRALLEQYGFWRKYPATGKRGRPRRDRLSPCKNLKHAQIIKIRQGGRLKEVIKKKVFGKEIGAEIISTSLIERLNLTLR